MLFRRGPRFLTHSQLFLAKNNAIARVLWNCSLLLLWRTCAKTSAAWPNTSQRSGCAGQTNRGFQPSLNLLEPPWLCPFLAEGLHFCEYESGTSKAMLKLPLGARLPPCKGRARTWCLSNLSNLSWVVLFQCHIPTLLSWDHGIMGTDGYSIKPSVEATVLSLYTALAWSPAHNGANRKVVGQQRHPGDQKAMVNHGLANQSKSLKIPKRSRSNYWTSLIYLICLKMS